VCGEHVKRFDVTQHLVLKASASVVHYWRGKARGMSKMRVSEDRDGTVRRFRLLMQRSQEACVESQQPRVSLIATFASGQGSRKREEDAPGMNRMTTSGVVSASAPGHQSANAVLGTAECLRVASV
jgi:hypothetical protein